MQKTFLDVPVNRIVTKSNYRRTFKDSSMKELTNSIKEHGIIEPVLLRLASNGKDYEIIAGERRVRAARLAGLVLVPAVVMAVSDEKFLETQLVENMQREAVPFMEEAYGLKNLRSECDLDVVEIAKKLSKSDAYVYQMLKLTEMCETAQVAASRGELGKSVALMISKLDTHDMQAKAAVDLRRSQSSKLIGTRAAMHYFSQAFHSHSNGGPSHTRRSNSRLIKEHGSDYAANWKKYLLIMSCEQFEAFKTACDGKTDVTTIANAVESVFLIEGGGVNEHRTADRIYLRRRPLCGVFAVRHRSTGDQFGNDGRTVPGVRNRGVHLVRLLG